MKVLLYDETPSYICHGGKQVHAQNIFESLRKIGVDVDYARWWDAKQPGDVIHLFGYSQRFVNLAHESGKKLVYTQILDQVTNSGKLNIIKNKLRNALIRKFPMNLERMFPWLVFSKIDAMVYMHELDARNAYLLFGISPEKSHIIPHGCGASQMARLKEGPRNSQSFLVSVGSIIPRKNTVLLAETARKCEVPVVFLGKPFNEEDAYYLRFLSLVDNRYVLYPGFVSEEEKNSFLTKASGFVLWSKAESGCIAAYEAASAGLPMLLPSLPWAFAYGKHDLIEYVDLNAGAALEDRLKNFFESARRSEGLTFPVYTWEEIARMYQKVYQEVLGVQ